MASSKYRDHTPEERAAMPLWLKACFVIQPFNASAKFDNIEQWAQAFSPGNAAKHKQLVNDQNMLMQFGEIAVDNFKRALRG